MNKQEILAEIERLKAEVKKMGDEFPQVEDLYYLIDSFGDIKGCLWIGNSEDKYRLATNNVFRTREDAKIWLEIQNRAIELRGDWVADYGDDTQSKFHLDWSWRDGKADINSWISHQIQGVFVIPQNAAETLIKEYGKRLKIWICGGLA